MPAETGQLSIRTEAVVRHHDESQVTVTCSRSILTFLGRLSWPYSSSMLAIPCYSVVVPDLGSDFSFCLHTYTFCCITQTVHVARIYIQGSDLKRCILNQWLGSTYSRGSRKRKVPYFRIYFFVRDIICRPSFFVRATPWHQLSRGLLGRLD